MFSQSAKNFWSRFNQNKAAVLGLFILTIVVAIGLTAGVVFPGGALKIVARPLIWPFTDPHHVLGTDSYGRDIMAFVFYGARVTLIIGLVAAFIAGCIGVLVGALAGYYSGWVDTVLMRVTDVFQTIPGIVLLLAVVAAFGPDINYITIAIGLASWTGIARLTRAQFLALKAREFVSASHALGVRDWRIMLEDILPNALPPVIVMSSLLVAGAVLYEAALSFLGFSDPDIASWGRLMGDGRPLLRAGWYVTAIPGIAVLLTVLALNLVGDGINDAMNPRLRVAGPLGRRLSRRTKKKGADATEGTSSK